MMYWLVMIALLILPHLVYGQAKGWEKEWNHVLEGAKREGKLVVATSPDPVMREIYAKFKARYGITVEHFGGIVEQACRPLSNRTAGGNQQRRCFSWRRADRGKYSLSGGDARSSQARIDPA
jgi:hypothetical protein